MSVGTAELSRSSGAGTGSSSSRCGGEIAARSPLALFWRRFRQDRVAIVSLAFIVFLIIVAFVAPLIVKALGLPGPYVAEPEPHRLRSAARSARARRTRSASTSSERT